MLMNLAPSVTGPSRWGPLEFINPIVERYRSWFKLFRLRGDAPAWCREL